MPFFHTRERAALYFKIWGHGKPVVLIHGWPLTSDTWDDLAIVLAENGFQAIAYDRRGFGRSEQTWNGYDYDSLTDDLSDLIDELEIDGAVLIGFSMGGGEVARYMSRYDGKFVRATALIASVVPYMQNAHDNPYGVDKEIFDGMMVGIKDDRAAFFTKFFKDFYGVGLLSQNVSDEVLAWSWTQAMQAGLKATLSCVESFATTDFRGDLSAFTVPTLIVHGTNDKTVPIDATGRVAAKAIQGAQFKEYRSAPHGIFATHKSLLIDDVLHFVQQVLK